MKNLYYFLICLFILNIKSAISQINYPFNECKENNVLAYWYNVPEDSVSLKMMGKTFKFSASLQIYGIAPGDSFILKAEVYLKDGKKIFEQTFNIEENDLNKTYSIQFNQGFFKLEKQTILVEYNNDLEIDGKILRNNSVGYYQIQLNYSGLTTYF